MKTGNQKEPFHVGYFSGAELKEAASDGDNTSQTSTSFRLAAVRGHDKVEVSEESANIALMENDRNQVTTSPQTRITHLLR